MSKNQAVAAITIVAAASGLFLGYGALHNYIFGWGFQEGWNLAVEQCNLDKRNCIPSGSAKALETRAK